MKRDLSTSSALLSAIAITAVFALSGCASSLGASEQMSDSGVISQNDRALSSESDSAGAPSVGGNAGLDFVDGTIAYDREVITTGSVTITAAEPIEAADEAIRITSAAGGRVDARTERAPIDGDQGSATLTLRLPSATLTASIDKFKELGEVESISLASLDVTSESQDLDARITALDASVERLLILLVKAKDTDTLISLETAISDRQAQLESLESQRRYLADQVSLSTIELVLISEADAPVDEPVNFWTGLTTGWSSLVVAASGLLILVGVLLPWIVVAGVITAIVVAIVRSRRRRHTQSVPATPVEEVQPAATAPAPAAKSAKK
jgi:hypothetical protein